MRVLLIDDHALFRFGLQELLERRGVGEVYAVGGREEGRRILDDKAPDVVLLDMRMPGASGLDVLRELRAAYPELPIAMLTTSAEEHDVVASLQQGARGYLLKDMEPDELVDALSDIVAGKTVVAKELAAVLAKAVQADARPRAAEPRFRLDASGARNPVSPRRRAEQQGDCRGAGHHGWYRQAPRQGDTPQAQCPFKGRSRGDCR